MKIINLLPKDQKKELELEFISHQILVFWILVATTLVVFVAVAWIFKFYLAEVITGNEKLIAQSQQRLESQEYKDLRGQIISLNSTVADIKNLDRHHYNWSEAMAHLADVVNPTVQLNDMQFDASSGEITITGQAKTRQDVIDLWANVVKSQYFSKINFPLANLDKPMDSNFTFTFSVNRDKFTNIKPK